MRGPLPLFGVEVEISMQIFDTEPAGWRELKERVAQLFSEILGPACFRL